MRLPAANPGERESGSQNLDFEQDCDEGTLRKHEKATSAGRADCTSTRPKPWPNTSRRPAFPPVPSSGPGWDQLLSLTERAIEPSALYLLVQRYLDMLPGGSSRGSSLTARPC